MAGSFLCIGHVPEDTSRPDDILKCIKPFITPHYFRHNHVTIEAGWMALSGSALLTGIK